MIITDITITVCIWNNNHSDTNVVIDVVNTDFNGTYTDYMYTANPVTKHKRILDDGGQICKSNQKDMLHKINKFKEHGVSLMHSTNYSFLSYS